MEAKLYRTKKPTGMKGKESFPNLGCATKEKIF